MVPASSKRSCATSLRIRTRTLRSTGRTSPSQLLDTAWAMAGYWAAPSPSSQGATQRPISASAQEAEAFLAERRVVQRRRRKAS